jgi:DNA-binding FadR family transcriptional regulator
MTGVVLVPKLHEVVMAELLAAIVRGDYDEGAKLPNEKALADSFQVSRYVAREGIQALRDRGLITVTHGVGAVVAPRHRWNLFDPALLDAMLAGPDAEAAAAEARECAAVVWPEVAALAAKRRSAADLEALEAAEDGQALRDALAQAAGNRFLGQAVGTLDRATGSAPALPPADPPAYRDVVDAVSERDADAARAAMAAMVRRAARAQRRRGG